MPLAGDGRAHSVQAVLGELGVEAHLLLAARGNGGVGLESGDRGAVVVDDVHSCLGFAVPGRLAAQIHDPDGLLGIGIDVAQAVTRRDGGHGGLLERKRVHAHRAGQATGADQATGRARSRYA